MSTTEITAGPAPPAVAAEPLDAAFAARPQTIIEPSSGWQLVNFAELWRFRELLYFLVWRDVKVRYKQTLLGVAWAVLQPALMMVVFTLFFGRMAKVPAGDLPYPLFVLAGLLPWTFFSTAISQGAQSVVSSERLITKIYFPRLAIPFASVGVAVVDAVIASGLILVLMAWYQVPMSPAVLLAAPIMLCLLLAAAGVGAFLAALNVSYRDFRYVVPFMVQLWMFSTPTIYMDPTANGVGRLDVVLAANPIAPLVAAFRAAVLGGEIHWTSLGIAAATCVGLFLAGCLYFRRVEDSFSDVI